MICSLFDSENIDFRSSGGMPGTKNITVSTVTADFCVFFYINNINNKVNKR